MVVNRRFIRVWPLFLSAGIILLDQASKWFIVRTIPLNTVRWELFGELSSDHPRAESGDCFQHRERSSQFISTSLLRSSATGGSGLSLRILPSGPAYLSFAEVAIAGIIDGGMENILDRIFRPYEVVDSIDIKFFSIFGLNRFPPFNLADSSVVICGILLVISFLQDERKPSERKAE